VELIVGQKTMVDFKDQGPKQWIDAKNDKVSVNCKQTIKTRGVGQVFDTGEAALAAPGKQLDKQPICKVNKASLKVFSTIFFTTGRIRTPVEIPWMEFLRTREALFLLHSSLVHSGGSP
jgi:hypothetical protein